MRFRLGTGTGTQHTADSFGRGFQSLFAAPLYEAQAAEEAQNGAMKRQLMESQIAAHLAEAALKRQKAEAGAAAPDVLSRVIAASAGTDVPTYNAWQNEVRTGRPAQTMITGDPTADAPMEPTPVDTPVHRDVARSLLTQFQRYMPALVNPDDVKMGDTAQAMGRYQQQDVLGQVLAGKQDPARVGQGFAAIEGKPLVDNIGNTGVGFNRFTGQGLNIDAGLRQLFGEEAAALVQQRKAAAGASGSAGRLSDARRERVIGGYDKPTTILDEDTGDATVTRFPTGDEPVTMGVAPKKASGTDATNAKERNRVVREVEKALGTTATDAEIKAEVTRRLARRGSLGREGAAPAAAAPPAPAPLDRKQRKAGEVYATPKGNMKWTGTGWLPAN